MSDYPSTIVGRTTEINCGNNQEKVNHECYDKCPANSTRNASNLNLCDCNTGYNQTASGACVKCEEPTPYWNANTLQCVSCSDYTQWDASSNSCVECSSSQKFNTKTKKCVDFDPSKYWHNNEAIDNCPVDYSPDDSNNCVMKNPENGNENENGSGNGSGNEPEEPPEETSGSNTKWIIIGGGIIVVVAIIIIIAMNRK